jgi:type II secretory pathway component GspD/PulD (secretin)
MAKIRVTKFLKKLSVIVMFCGVSASHATAIDTHRSINVKTFHVDEKIVRKVIPVIRVLIAKQGHLASVSGTNKLVVAAKPETLAVLEDIFANLDVEKFDPKQLRNEAKKRLKDDVKDRMIKRVIQLKNLQAKSLIPAIRSLVSFEGSLRANRETNQIEIIDLPKYVDGIETLINQLES